MRVTLVEMYSASFEEAITFSLENEEPNAQYQARSILGLDADDIVPKFYGSSISGGSKYYDFALKPRDIVIRVVLSPRFNLDESYSDVRDRLYRTISANRSGLVTLHFSAEGSLISQIVGSIIKFEATHFTNLPEVQITIRCNDPMFKGISPVIFEPADLQVANPVKFPDSLSTAPHGFSMQLTFDATTPSFTVQDVAASPEWKFKVIPTGGFLSGDVLYFSSERSNKHIYYVRGASTVQLGDKIESGSMWPIIFPGQNEFHFVDIASFNWNSVEYFASYWGV